MSHEFYLGYAKMTVCVSLFLLRILFLFMEIIGFPSIKQFDSVSYIFTYTLEHSTTTSLNYFNIYIPSLYQVIKSLVFIFSTDLSWLCFMYM